MVKNAGFYMTDKFVFLSNNKKIYDIYLYYQNGNMFNEKKLFL